MPRRKKNSNSSNSETEAKQITQPMDSADKEDLKNKLRLKKMEFKYKRMSKFLRDQEISDIEERLDEKISGREKKCLKEKLKILLAIEEQEIVNSMIPGDFQDAD